MCQDSTKFAPMLKQNHQSTHGSQSNQLGRKASLSITKLSCRLQMTGKGGLRIDWGGVSISIHARMPQISTLYETTSLTDKAETSQGSSRGCSEQFWLMWLVVYMLTPSWLGPEALTAQDACGEISGLSCWQGPQYTQPPPQEC